MATLDTNVLVRWVVQDDDRQTEGVAHLLAASARRRERLWVPLTVLLELEWVLRARYGFDKAAVVSVIDALLSTDELDLQHASALEQALWRFRPGDAPDFADCLHLAQAHEADQTPLWTFDRRAAKQPDARLMPN